MRPRSEEGFRVRIGLPPARSVFAAAAHRCSEIFEAPGCVTLWRLPEATEEEFDTGWNRRLDSAEDWKPFFQRVEALQGTDLAAMQGRLLDAPGPAGATKKPKKGRAHA